MKTRWLVAGVVALLAVTAGPAVAQGGGQARGKPTNQGQAKKAEREAQARFQDHDRQVANNWYSQNRTRQLPPGLRDKDRLPPPMEARLRPGVVLDRDMRSRVHPAPAALVRGFSPAPRGYRYVVIGGHIVLVDSGYRVFDDISLQINLGR